MTTSNSEPVADAAARQRALEPTQSFCVSAPAGSGKTGLLVKRFLRLLARVREPESVVAITFTRKAAAEMRARIIGALQQAQETGEGECNAHARELLELAGSVREHDRKQGWGLMANPSRLRIQTIDSFCGYLTRQMPVLSGSGGQINATDRSEALYRQAIEQFLADELAAQRSAADSDLRTLLLHLDNNWDNALRLLSRLLQRREQWQPVFGGAGLGERERRGLEEIAASLISYRIERLRDALGTTLSELTALVHYREQQLGSGLEFDPSADDLRAWKSLGNMLLTGDGDWRKRVNKNDGFPTGKGEARDYKDRVMALLEHFRDQEDNALLSELRQLDILPDASQEPQHWAVLAALTRLLPRLGAQLLLVFRRAGEVDHAQVAMAALSALGEDEAPTDLALRLDHVIEHLLVDEFQDTSSVQFELVRRLTRGWAEHNAQNPDGARTLLLVGDAMQSIYGFREANVGLFIRARNEGIGDLELEALDLSVNFRSRSALVSWSNRQFVAAFPPGDDPQLGAVSFRPALAFRDGGSAPELALFAGEGAQQAELAALCDRVEQGVRDDAVESIAILGRSRRQLRPVLQALRERGVTAAARDLDTLAQRQLVQDLITLCDVLSDHYNRFAWLSLLRTPAIGLEDRDLLLMAQHAPTAAEVLDEGFLKTEPATQLSDSARARLHMLEKLLHWAEHYRDRLALRVWVEECWLRLGGAALLETEADRLDVEQFFRCLEQLESDGLAFHQRNLREAVERLFAAPGDAQCKVQVMTLHKAKGLEFDWVFIPALAGGTAGNDSELLLWDEFTLPQEQTAFLLDIRPQAGSEKSAQLYDYLKAQARQKSQHESTRLFYVGCTRAAEYLWLGASLKWDETKGEARAPASGSLLQSIWPTLAPQAEVMPMLEEAAATEAAGSRYRRLRRVPELATVPPTPEAQADGIADNRLARAYGTALHRCLESLVYRGQLPMQVDPALETLLQVALRESGVEPIAADPMQARGVQTLNRVLSDSHARWMLAPQRAERAAELPLGTLLGEEARQLILDYVFVDETRGERWVVDYKTAEPPVQGGALEEQGAENAEEAFMQSQLAQYAEQLELYRHALSQRYPEPVRCGLYFTALAQFRELPVGHAPAHGGKL